MGNAIVAVVLWGVTVAAAAPSAGSVEDDAKQLYEQGEQAMAAKAYDDALRKFEQAYALVRHRHLFNYNIAVAAELAGDCGKAIRHYQMFLDLVFEHPRLGDARRTVARLEQTCPRDEESAGAVSKESVQTRDAARGRAAAIRFAQDLIRQVRRSVRFYEGVAADLDDRRFRRVARQQTRHGRRLERELDRLGVPEPPRELPVPPVPATLGSACTRAEQFERRKGRAYADLPLHFDSRKLERLSRRYRRATERRNRAAFENCAP